MPCISAGTPLGRVQQIGNPAAAQARNRVVDLLDGAVSELPMFIPHRYAWRDPLHGFYSVFGCTPAPCAPSRLGRC